MSSDNFFTMLTKGVGYLAKGAGVPGAGWSIAVPKALKDYIDKDDEKLLSDVRTKEGCSHIALIDGWAGPHANMLYWMKDNGGMAFRAGDKNWKTYWHPQESFRPISATSVFYINTRGWAKKSGWQLPSQRGELCGLCERARATRLEALQT